MSKTSVPTRRTGVRSWLAAVALLSGALLLATGAPALAAETINLNPDDVPTTAAEFTQHCDPDLGGGPFPNDDVWEFDLPGDPDTTGTFQSVTVTFSTPGGNVTRTIPTDPDSAIVNNLGTSKAWITLPAGWTLTGGTAVISGTGGPFVLSGACAAAAVPVVPRLVLAKTGTPTTNLHVGDKVTYTYTVTNETIGTTSPITGITITDNKITGITCQTTSLAPGASTTCTGTHTVTDADVANGKITNTARATGALGEQTVTSNEADFTVTTAVVPVQPSLSIEKKARVERECREKCEKDEKDDFAAKGDKIFYTYRVTNTGNVTITNVAVDDPTAGPVVCDSTTLAPGASTECHAVNPHVVTESDVKAGKVVNTARATGRFENQTVVSEPVTVIVCIRPEKEKEKEHGKDHLPVTGDSLANVLGLGSGLLAAGGALLGASRIRRRIRI